MRGRRRERKGSGDGGLMDGVDDACVLGLLCVFVKRSFVGYSVVSRVVNTTGMGNIRLIEPICIGRT
jgi:hypothetical protein